MPINQIRKHVKKQYDLKKELKFPFGNNYGWGYKYSHKATHLCYAFFEKEAFTILIQIGDNQVSIIESMINTLSEKTKELWETRYPCGNHGGWIQYRILGEEDFLNVIKFINVKKCPLSKSQKRDTVIN